MRNKISINRCYVKEIMDNPVHASSWARISFAKK